MKPRARTPAAVASNNLTMSTETAPTNLNEIDALAKHLAQARELLSRRVTTLQEQLEATKRRFIPGIKAAVEAVKEAESKLEVAVKAAPPATFADPRTIVVHGIRVGYMKAKGKIEFDDEKSVIKRIREHFPKAKADVLIKVTEKLQKKALGNLSVDDLRKIGCTVTTAGDGVYIKAVSDTVDKLVEALLNEVTSTEGEE